MIGKVYKKQGGSGGGEIINGIIEQYKASTSTINANSFVEFVNNETTGTDTYINSSNNTGVGNKVARKIDNNKVFIIYQSDVSNYYLTGVVCTINGTTITSGTPTTISSTQYSSRYINMETIDTNKVYIAYSLNSYSTPYGIVCTVSGTSISKGSYQIIGDGNSQTTYKSINKIDTNKIFACYAYKSSRYLYGVVHNISGTTITAGSNTEIIYTSNTGYYVDSSCVDTNKVFINHRSNSSDSYVYGLVCTINGTSITAGTDTQITTEKNSAGYNKSIKLDIDKVFLVYQIGLNGDARLYAKICTINGTTITSGTSTTIVNEPATDSTFGLIDTNMIYVAFSRGYSTPIHHILSRVICKIKDSSITTGSIVDISNTRSSGENPSLEVIDKGKVIIVHKSDGTNQKLNGIIREVSAKIKLSETQIDGITKDEITTSTAGDVWVLNQ